MFNFLESVLKGGSILSKESIQTAQEQRKTLRRNRIKKYFVCAAKEILNSEGLSAITIRRVAEMAGYNSATLYNYFDDLNHLSFLACMETLEKYNKIVTQRVHGIENPIDLYLTTADCFSEFSYQEPEVFWQLFYGCPEEKRESYVKEYYELFPSETPESYQTLKRAKLTHNINQRNLIFLSGCIEAGYLTPENAELYDGISSMLTRCLLEDLTNKKITPEDALKKSHIYYRHLLKSYLEPEYQHLLNEN